MKCGLVRLNCLPGALILLLLLPAHTAAAKKGETRIDQVEPPFWWLGFEQRELQLMFYGTGVSRLQAFIDYPGVTVAKTETGDSENYLFLYIGIEPDARPGEFEITFADPATGASFGHLYALLPRTSEANHVDGYSAEDVIYLITPDRFANGDPANDSVIGYGDPPDRDAPYGRHGGDIAGIRQHLDYVADMGFTQIWLNPVLENAMPGASYHGYATTDFYQVDPRFGSNEDYRSLVADAKARGIGVIMDVIVNHIGSEHPWMEDLPTDDWINFPAEMTTHARTTNQDPYASEFDSRLMEDGWFAETMPDLNQANPLLGDYLVQNAIFWIEYLGLSGLRVDTWPYPDKDYMSEWTRRIVAEYPEINIVGEEWSPNPVITSYWQAGKENHDGYVSYLPGLFDFPLQIALAEALTAPDPEWGSAWTPVYEMLANDFLYPDPYNLVIFPDNHDMSRVFTQVGEDTDLFRMAIAFYLTMRGIPQIYYGTEILMSHPGTDSHGEIRSDFPGGWPGDAANAFTGDGMTDTARNAQAFMRQMLEWRKSADVVHAGRLMQFAPVGNVYVYFRYDENDTLMVIFNRDHEAVDLDTARFAERIGDGMSGTDVITGRRFDVTGKLRLAARSVLVLELAD